MNLLVKSCWDCPFYCDRYCSLAIKLNEEHETNYSTFVLNEWREETCPSNCPLKTSDVTMKLIKA